MSRHHKTCTPPPPSGILCFSPCPSLNSSSSILTVWLNVRPPRIIQYPCSRCSFSQLHFSFTTDSLAPLVVMRWTRLHTGHRNSFPRTRTFHSGLLYVSKALTTSGTQRIEVWTDPIVAYAIRFI